MKKFLIKVEVTDNIQSNKYYNLELAGEDCITTWGRVGGFESKKVYPGRKFESIYRSKLRGGYEDITHLKEAPVQIADKSNNKDFDEFFEVFSKYTRNVVQKNYIVDKCTPQQKSEAQKRIDLLSSATKVDDVNDILLDLYKIIPRKMNNVRNFLITDLIEKDNFIASEQDMLDSMDSSNIIQESNVLSHLNISFEKIEDKKIVDSLQGTSGGRVRVKALYKIVHPHQKTFDTWLEKQSNQHCELLIHGTRNPNIFSILKEGLRIRPSNAAMISGAAYGNGVYHSAHTAKSLGYTGYDRDKIFFLQNVHMGNFYTYSGWYREGKSISRSEMNYTDLKKKGYDSLYVKAGDGLLNSEYIVYKSEQTVTNYLAWLI